MKKLLLLALFAVPAYATTTSYTIQNGVYSSSTYGNSSAVGVINEYAHTDTYNNMSNTHEVIEKDTIVYSDTYSYSDTDGQYSATYFTVGGLTSGFKVDDSVTESNSFTHMDTYGTIDREFNSTSWNYADDGSIGYEYVDISESWSTYSHANTYADSTVKTTTFTSILE